MDKLREDALGEDFFKASLKRKKAGGMQEHPYSHSCFRFQCIMTTFTLVSSFSKGMSTIKYCTAQVHAKANCIDQKFNHHTSE
jgi:hypothetical protein